MAKAIQVRSVPDEVHRRLKVRAAQEGRTLSDLIRAELIDVAGRPTLPEMVERIRSRPSVSVDEPSARAVRSGRDER